MLKYLIINILLCYSSLAFSANFTSVITGDWDDGATWGNTSPGVAGVDYPAAGDNIVISSGTNVSLTSDETIVNVDVQTGGILDAITNDMEITINGTLNVDGNLKSNSKDIIFNGGAGTTIDGIGTIFMNNSGKSFKVFGNTSILSSADLIVFGKIEIQNGIILTNNGSITVDDDINGMDGSSEWINAASSSVNVKTSIMATGVLTASATNNTVTYSGANQNITTPASSIYYNIVSSGSAAKTNTQQANLIITNNLIMLGGTYNCNNYNINLAGDWINSGATFDEANGQVILDGGGAQTINTVSGETFYQLELTAGGTVSIATSGIAISNTLTMTSGNFSTGNNKITLGISPATGILSHTSGTVIGYFERWLSSSTGINYLYPIGSSSNYNPANINFNTISSDGTATCRFIAAGPGNNGLSLVDGATTIYNTFVDGYWEFTTANSFSASDFDLDLSGNGFTAFPIDAATRLLTRPDGGSAWIAEGTHVSAVGNTAKRTNINTIPGHFAFGDDSNCPPPTTPTVTSADTDPCTSTTGTYSVTNNAGSTYSWSISPASAGTFNPVPAAGDFSVTIDWGANGTAAKVICKENNGCTFSDLDSLDVNVHSIAPTILSGRKSIAKATIGEPYSITGLAGYTYTWTITGGTLMSGQGSSSITVDWDNTVGTGSIGIVAQSGGGCTAATSFDTPIKRYEVINSNGIGGGDWNTPATWDCTCVPIATDNVRILSGDVVTLGSYAITIKNMIIQVSATLERITDNNKITVTEDLDHDGLITLGSGPEPLVLEGIGTTIKGGGIINITAGAKVDISNGHKTISSTTILTINGGNLDIINSSIIVTNNGNVTISGNLDFKDGSNNWINTTNSTLNIGGDINPVGTLTVSSAGNTVNYYGAGNQNVRLPATSYYNLTFSTSGTKLGLGNIDVNGDFIIKDAAQFDGNGNIYTFGGGWTNSSTHLDPFFEAGSTVTFDGSIAQTITVVAGETFENLIFNNTSTGVILAASTDVTVTSALTMTDGVVDTRTNSRRLIINDAATASGASDASYVLGFVRKIGKDPFEFPIGDSGHFAPSSISAPSVSTDAFDSEYYFNGPNAAGYDTSLHAASINHLSNHEYWIINRTAGTTDVSVTLSWGSPRSGGVTVLPDMAVARWDGAAWVDHSNGGTTGNTAAGTVTSLAAVTLFSPFTLGSSTSANPLPIELVTFNAVLNKDFVEISWTTVTEINNDYFTIERSSDAKDWKNVAEVNGASTSSSTIDYFEIDYKPLEGKSYYRLKQTDFNGTVSYSNIAPVSYIPDAGSEQTMLLYPNPNDGQNVNVKLNGFENKEVLIIVRDITGKEMYSKAIYSQHNGIVELVTLENKLPSGTYLITASSKQIFISKKLMVK